MKGTVREGLIAVADDGPKVVTVDDPLVITSVSPTFPWIQIQSGGEIRVQVTSTVTIEKLEMVAAGAREKA